MQKEHLQLLAAYDFIYIYSRVYLYNHEKNNKQSEISELTTANGQL